MKSNFSTNAQHWAIGRMESLRLRLGRPQRLPPHLSLGLEGEREALFELRRRGYTVVARRWTSSKMRGDIDLVAWDEDWLCFIEVKTRSERSSMTPAETAVDRDKQRTLRRLASAYLRSFPEERRGRIPVRFDVLAVYTGHGSIEFELFRGAFGWR